MKNAGRLIIALFLLSIVLGAVILVFKLISGAAAVLSGAVNAVLGIVIVLSLLVIVIWMLGYAKKK